MNPFKSPEFKELERLWYDKLKEEGFQDIEESPDKAERGSGERMLVRSHSADFKRVPRSNIESSYEYYYFASQFLLHENGFKNEKHRKVWELHCEGVPEREIAEKAWSLQEVPSSLHHRRNKGEKIKGMESFQITVRPYEEKIDAPFIFNSWSRSAYYSSKPRPSPKKDWFQAKIHSIKDALQEGTVYVACLKEDPIFFLGYIVLQKNQIQFLYVKQDYKNQGIEELLTNKFKDINETRKASETRTEDLTDRDMASSSTGPKAY